MLLKQAEAKARHEWPVLRDDLADLDVVLHRLGLGGGAGQVMVDGLDTAALEADISARDRALVEALPTLDDAAREASREHVRQMAAIHAIDWRAGGLPN